jgi:hypothetical protein
VFVKLRLAAISLDYEQGYLDFEMAMQIVNSAIVTEDVIFEVLRVLERGYPVGPSFVESLSSLVEAVVIHDKVYRKSFEELVDKSKDEANPQHWYSSSPLIKMLTKELLLEQTNAFEIEAILDAKQSYNYTDFLTDWAWSPSSTLSITPESEMNFYGAMIDTANCAPHAFEMETLVETGDDRPVLGVLPLLAKGFTKEDLLYLESLNRAERAYEELSRGLNLNLYTPFKTTASRVGMIRSKNQQTRHLFKKIQDKAVKMLEPESEFIENDFSRIRIAPLCQIVLRNCKGSASALGDELLSLREKHKGLRKFLTEFEKREATITTREESRQLRADLQYAFENLAKFETTEKTRMFYKVARLAVEPLKIPGKAVEALSEKGSQYEGMDRIRGLHDFYKDLAGSPLERMNGELLSKMFPTFAPDKLWEAASEFGKTIEEKVLSGKQAVRTSL